MREIKYRQFIDGRFYYWGYGVMPEESTFVSPTTQSGVHLAPSEQYTGLNDMNGIKIYEGDILQLKNERGSLTGAMKWDETRNGWMQFEPFDRFEIIGNIHENPELLSK